VRDQAGKFAQADDGTIFLDEVGDMSLRTQSKVLRALQDGEIEPVDETIARLRAVTAEDVQRVAKRVIGQGQYSLAVVGPSAEADRLDAILTA
jgi:transcriptional regulator with GAF, ATPase, and Fis domain